MPKTHKMTLKAPIEWGTETVTELEFREPKAKDFRKFPMNPAFGDVLDLMAALCTRSDGPVLMDELSVEDLMAASEMIGDFIPGGRETGKTR